MQNVTLDLVYHELMAMKKQLNIVEHAVIPTEKLSAKELEEHKKDLSEALSGKRVEYKDL